MMLLYGSCSVRLAPDVSKDYAFLERAGVKAIFGPGTQIPKAARRVLELIEQTPADAAVGA